MNVWLKSQILNSLFGNDNMDCQNFVQLKENTSIVIRILLNIFKVMKKYSVPLWDLGGVTHEEHDDDGGQQGDHGVVSPLMTGGGVGEGGVDRTTPRNHHILSDRSCQGISHFLSPRKMR